jgi:hypothetical protein
MLTYNVWENKETGELVLRPASTELRDTYWKVVNTMHVETRNDAVSTFNGIVQIAKEAR